MWCLHTKHVLHSRNWYIAHDVCKIYNHVRSLQERLCKKTRYTVKSQWNVFWSIFCLVKAETLFFLGALYFRLHLGIHQNIIHQFLQWAISPTFSPSKILYRTVYSCNMGTCGLLNICMHMPNAWGYLKPGYFSGTLILPILVRGLVITKFHMH